ncbi:MAG: superoxide dismutase [Candidatus Harrisonbacteria bacterium RIFCSPLOWO2_01_FULL_40_28]|uniref:Superoxide dismutase n=1 Tax=Candidatus Harrisonbacteria bacterium RIFCSPLOWO2_01_FULL_40_28 TaxID=1798406 RepID=A0A1G1ZPE9_9BACT|nr:MAG: superoxide dismutase [Candidatus Harrisonbacteria bacterium RIFCSPLOWO2_01_FULL_40_28]
MKHQLLPLPYEYSALEPFIDTKTMELHYSKHHATYVEKLNTALETFPALHDKPIEELLQNFNNLPESLKISVINHGGGHYNHSFFWNIMCPPSIGGGTEPIGRLATLIESQFDGFKTFQEEFNKKAVGVFGSGWVWLVVGIGGDLQLTTTQNQDSPLMQGLIPLIGLDLWEHAYYLKYQNRRQEYVSAWWNVVHWKAVEVHFEKIKEAR